MAASRYEAEVLLGITAAADPNDNPGARCEAGGAPAANSTQPTGIPIIREWEYASGAVIAFSKIDSCLGVIQMASKTLIRGAHFSMFASSSQYDVVQFDAAMGAAGFVLNLPILFFGGGVDDWKEGLDGTAFRGVGPFPPLLKDASQKRWIFQLDNGAFTYHAM
ncbi:MAG: hypothetical protein RSP_16730 [Rhodanobacter sp.]